MLYEVITENHDEQWIVYRQWNEQHHHQPDARTNRETTHDGSKHKGEK